MPDQFVIPTTDESRRSIYYDLGLESRIISGEDAETILREFHELVQPYTLQESDTFQTVYDARVGGGGGQRFPWLPIDVTQELIRRSTEGRASMEEGTRGSWTFGLSGRLDSLGWASYLRDHGLSVDHCQARTRDQSRGGENRPCFYSEDIRVHVLRYEEYARDRAAHIRNEIRRTRGLAYGEDQDSSKNVRSGTGDFSRFLQKVHSQLQPNDNPFEDAPILPRGTLSSRKWGIEIEAVHIDGVSTPEFWELKGDGSLRPITLPEIEAHAEGCNSLQPPGCDCGACRNDCDCSAGRSGSSRTGEWNSPILRSFHSRGLEYLCSQLEDRQTNDSAGIHVHVSAADLTPEQAAKVALIYTALEPLFKSQYFRNRRNYCEEISASGVLSRIKSMKAAQRAGKSIRTTDSSEGRYYTVNLEALRSHGTIEFRAMGPKYNYEHLIKWAWFLREILNLAKSNAPQRAWASARTFRDVVEVFAKYGKETPTPEWSTAKEPARDIVSALGTENRVRPNRSSEPEFPVETVFEDYTRREPAFR